MSIFSAIGSFFKHIFQKLRPGLDGFLKKYEGLAVNIVKELAIVHDGKSFHEWKDEAFDKIKVEVAKDVDDVKDNWLSLLLGFAFEELKGLEAEKK